ncbi:MAG: hypothetical protein C6I01_04810 [Epsilonproteobacteria bacterium]|nr:hypothetical protein [Campylobacterota bacterium]
MSLTFYLLCEILEFSNLKKGKGSFFLNFPNLIPNPENFLQFFPVLFPISLFKFPILSPNCRSG